VNCEDEPDTDDDEALFCNSCSTTFKNKTTKMAHIRDQHGEGRKFSCILCPAIFKCARYLRKHVRNVHTGRPYKFSCVLCPTSFMTRGNLVAHLKVVHVTGRPFACDFCPATYKAKYTLTKHIRKAHSDCEVLQDEGEDNKQISGKSLL